MGEGTVLTRHGLRRLACLLLVAGLAVAASATSAQAWSLGQLAGAATSAAAKPKPTPGAPVHIRSYVTLYGFVDNSPPSAIISNPRIHKTAGGTGTFTDPVTFATDVHEFRPGTIVYYAYLKKYFIMEDTCTECTKDWSGGGNGDNPVPAVHGHRYRIDLWAGGDRASLHNPEKRALLNCEDALTQPKGGDIFVNAPSGLPVVTTPIFDSKTLRCQTP
jgi:hypothetical protein